MKRILPLAGLCGGCCVAVLAGCHLTTGARDRAEFVDYSDDVARSLQARAAGSQPAVARPTPVLKAVPVGVDAPVSPAEFHRAWHHEPVLQGLTGQCWAFGATSFFESEVHRLTKREIKLSEMYPVYWEFVEKARRFVRQRGDSEFGRGSEPDAVIRIWKTYGVVPASAYRGMPNGRDFYDDRRVYAELREYLSDVRQRRDWDEERAVTAVRAILDKHLGPPPSSVEAKGRAMSPQEYLREVVRLDLDNYVSLVSFLQEPFYAWCEYDVPDNWRRAHDYFNVPLGDFVNVVRQAASDGQSLCLGIDNTEPGFLFRQDIAFVPAFDVSPGCIDDAARQLRFGNGNTTDDHVVHMVGSCQRGGQAWYLVKDSDTRSRNGHHGGYMFYREDYVRLKVMVIMLPRDAAERALGRPLS